MLSKNLVKWLCLFTVACVTSHSSAELVGLDLELIPVGSGCNNLNLTVSADALGTTKSDTDQTDASGALKVLIQAEFEPDTAEPIWVTSLEFTGGDLSLTDVAFNLNYGWLLGSVNIQGSGLGGTADTPNPPGPVIDSSFNTAWHELIMNRGVLDASGTGLVGGLFPPTTINLADEAIHATTQGSGTIELSLIQISGRTATYQVDLSIPVNFSEKVLEDTENGIIVRVSGVGTLCAMGVFNRTYCPLASDLDDDCKVTLSDLAQLVLQWQKTGCTLSADLAGEDCRVDLLDFAFLTTQWLAGF